VLKYQIGKSIRWLRSSDEKKNVGGVVFLTRPLVLRGLVYADRVIREVENIINKLHKLIFNIKYIVVLSIVQWNASRMKRAVEKPHPPPPPPPPHKPFCIFLNNQFSRGDDTVYIILK